MNTNNIHTVAKGLQVDADDLERKARELRSSASLLIHELNGQPATSHPADCPCERQGPLFHLAQRMEEVILARRDGHWSNDWDIAQAHVLEDYDTWRSA